MKMKRVYYLTSETAQSGYDFYKVIGKGKAQNVHNKENIEDVKFLIGNGFKKVWINEYI